MVPDITDKVNETFELRKASILCKISIKNLNETVCD